MFQYLDELSLKEPKEVNCEQCEEYVGWDKGLKFLLNAVCAGGHVSEPEMNKQTTGKKL